MTKYDWEDIWANVITFAVCVLIICIFGLAVWKIVDLTS